MAALQAHLEQVNLSAQSIGELECEISQTACTMEGKS